MSTRRHRPVTTMQAILGTIAIVGIVAALVGLSHLLLLPAGDVPLFDPPVLEDENSKNPGEITCPSGQNLAARPEPMPVTSAELIECPGLFDGEEVRYEGEAVGEVLLRSTSGWVHVNDDIYGVQIGPLSEHRTVAGGNSGMAVSMPREDAVRVTAGGHRRVGTALSIVGTFVRADRRDHGAPAIRATDVEIVRESRAVAAPPTSLRRVVAAAVLSLLIAAMALGVRNARRRRD